MEDIRYSLPLAYCDPAFRVCLDEAINTLELVENFNRLYGAKLMSNGKPSDKDMRAFVEFVHDGIYLRIPADAIHSLRACALAAPQSQAEQGA